MSIRLDWTTSQGRSCPERVCCQRPGPASPPRRVVEGGRALEWWFRRLSGLRAAGWPHEACIKSGEPHLRFAEPVICRGWLNVCPLLKCSRDRQKEVLCLRGCFGIMGVNKTTAETTVITLGKSLSPRRRSSENDEMEATGYPVTRTPSLDGDLERSEQQVLAIKVKLLDGLHHHRQQPSTDVPVDPFASPERNQYGHILSPTTKTHLNAKGESN